MSVRLLYVCLCVIVSAYVCVRLYTCIMLWICVSHFFFNNLFVFYYNVYPFVYGFLTNYKFLLILHFIECALKFFVVFVWKNYRIFQSTLQARQYHVMGILQFAQQKHRREKKKNDRDLKLCCVWHVFSSFVYVVCDQWCCVSMFIWVQLFFGNFKNSGKKSSIVISLWFI